MSEDEIRHILLDTRRVAAVGASDKPTRPSHGVTAFLIGRGYDVVPVNPALAGRSIHGRPVVASLAQAGPLDMVDVFRRSAEAGAVMREAIRLGARTVWLQSGVVDEAAAAEARAAGLRVVMDRCPAIEWPRLRLPGRRPPTRAHISDPGGRPDSGGCRGPGNIGLEAEQEPDQLGAAMQPRGELT